LPAKSSDPSPGHQQCLLDWPMENGGRGLTCREDLRDGQVGRPTPRRGPRAALKRQRGHREHATQRRSAGPAGLFRTKLSERHGKSLVKRRLFGFCHFIQCASLAAASTLAWSSTMGHLTTLLFLLLPVRIHLPRPSPIFHDCTVHYRDGLFWASPARSRRSAATVRSCATTRPESRCSCPSSASHRGRPAIGLARR
jgi:hypothetical protein